MADDSTGWPPGRSYDPMTMGGMDPEAARRDAWVKYRAEQNQGYGGAQLPKAPAIGPGARFYGEKQAPPPTRGGDSGGGGLNNLNLGSSGGFGSGSVNMMGGGSMGGSDSLLTPRGTSVTGGDQLQGLLQQLISQFQTGSNQANQAGLQQYQNLLRSMSGTSKSIIGKGGLFDQAGGLLSNYGKSAQQQLQQQTQNAMGSAQQNAISRGLGNTTIADSLKQGVQRTSNQANLQLQDQLAAQRVGLLTNRAGMTAQLGGMYGDALLSRQNQGPNLGQYLGLIGALAGR